MKERTLCGWRIGAFILLGIIRATKVDGGKQAEENTTEVLSSPFPQQKTSFPIPDSSSPSHTHRRLNSIRGDDQKGETRVPETNLF